MARETYTIATVAYDMAKETYTIATEAYDMT